MVIVCLLVIALMVASTVPVGAKKPIKPPPDGGSDPTGTIFYSNADANDDFNIYSMNADGSSKTKEVQWVDGMDAMSLKKHGDDGNYWYAGFIATNDDPHPDGVAKTELYAIQDDGLKSKVLWDDPYMSYDDWNGPPVWLTGDSHLSWAALKWAEDDTIDEAGIYKAAITFSDGVPSMSTPTLVWSTGTYSHGGGNWYTPDVSCPNWSLDGTKVVMASVENGGTVVDLTDIDEPVETVLGGSIFPKWSPDGTKLAYSYNHKELRVMNPDGTGDTELTSIKSSKKRTKDIMRFDWSPDSKFLMYTVVTFSLMTWDRSADIFTIGVDGTGNTCLTNGINGPDWFWGRDWR